MPRGKPFAFVGVEGHPEMLSFLSSRLVMASRTPQEALADAAAELRALVLDKALVGKSSRTQCRHFEVKSDALTAKLLLRQPFRAGRKTGRTQNVPLSHGGKERKHRHLQET